MKKLFVVVLSVMISVSTCFVMSASAATENDTISISVGQKFNDWGTDLGTVYVDSHSRTMVPLRAAANLLGLSVKWDDKKKEAVFSDDSTTVTFYQNSDEYSIGSIKLKMNSEVVNRDGRIYAPVRYLAEAFNYYVSWNDELKSVQLTPGISTSVVFSGDTGKLGENGITYKVFRSMRKAPMEFDEYFDDEMEDFADYDYDCDYDYDYDYCDDYCDDYYYGYDYGYNGEVLLLTNHTNETYCVDISCIFYDENGKMSDLAGSYILRLSPKETAVKEIEPSDVCEYSSMKYILDLEELERDGEDNVGSFTVKNDITSFGTVGVITNDTKKTLNISRISVQTLFFKDGDLVGFDTTEIEPKNGVMKPSAMKVFKTYCERDFDSVAVFCNNSYWYWYW